MRKTIEKVYNTTEGKWHADTILRLKWFDRCDILIGPENCKERNFECRKTFSICGYPNHISHNYVPIKY